MFKSVSSQVDFPALERELLKFWQKNRIVEKYLNKNKDSDKKFSFLDGPITANNPMGVHHGWGRTYKDLWQRFFNMRGFKQRFQNGFDEQGLWVEVEVEKELGLKSKKDILNLVPGDEFASLEKFVNLCKERVKKYAAIQTEQSKRLGYFMDWDNSYHTSSDENNFAIWNFLKTVHDKGWLYKGHDSVPWCPRCGTAISQHEIESEGYKELTHDSLYIEYPVEGRVSEYLLVWTTTPWTLPGNVAIAIDPKKNYVLATEKVEGNKYYLSKNAAEKLKLKLKKTIKGSDIIGLKYSSPFEHLPGVKKVMDGHKYQTIATDQLILPILDEEGTGLVHIAPGAGSEDFALGKKLNLPVVELIDENANYLADLGEFSYKNAKNNPEIIFNHLKNYQKGKYLFGIVPYTHRYPTCWRCKQELVWRVVDEWYISMDGKDASGKTYRGQIMDVAQKINWSPKWALDRELDWLKNMHDWLISKKRFWGLSLPIWECKKCGNFDVLGSGKELKEKAAQGWKAFEGHSPHRPWIDLIKIKCSKCSELIPRITDVGNPWLDAGIVPFSTLPKDWFPADFIVEGFPGQFKNWFYSLLTMSTALANTNPFQNILGFANVVDEKGNPMHKSTGNAIEFNEAADKAGVDAMRWLYLTQNPEDNLKFGYKSINETRRRFFLVFWNCYKFFIDYAQAYNWNCRLQSGQRTILDKWVLARLTQVVIQVTKFLEKYDAASASREIEEFIVGDFSTWYIRRIRDRVGPNSTEEDRNLALSVLYGNLVTLCKLLAPFTPFLSEAIYQNLETGDQSVHLTDYPLGDKSLFDDKLVKDMQVVRKIVEMGHGKRKEAGIKLRQPLGQVTYFQKEKLSSGMEEIIAEELNVKTVEYKKYSKDLKVELDTKITQVLKEEGQARELIRQIQQLRKDTGLTFLDKIEIFAPNWSKTFEHMILKSTAAKNIKQSEKLEIKKN